MIVPNYAILLVMATALFLTSGVSVLITYGIQNARMPDTLKRRLGWTIALSGFVWLTIVLLTSYSNALVPQMDDIVPYLGVFICGSTVLVSLLVLLIPRMRDILSAVPIAWLAGIQIYRVIGVVFLLLEADGLLSQYFAFSTAWGDIFVGVTAPIVAILLHRDARKYLWVGIAWCVMGIGDLVLVLYKAINSAPGPLQTTAFDIPTEVAGYFPFSILPLIIVPISIILHLVLMQKLFGFRSDQTALGIPKTS